MLPAAQALVARHREDGHVCAIITATNRFVTGPIAAAFGVEHLIATEAEERGGEFTGGDHVRSERDQARGGREKERVQHAARGEQFPNGEDGEGEPDAPADAAEGSLGGAVHAETSREAGIMPRSW